MLQEKSSNRMSIEHILCSPCDEGSAYNNSMYYGGLPSPVTSYQGSDDDDDDDDDDDVNELDNCHRSELKQHRQYTTTIYPPFGHQRTFSDHSQLHRRAILPYRRRRTQSTNSESDSFCNNGGGSQTRMPWTPHEDILLKQGYEQGLSWALIASTYLPHRSRGCCWGRFKTLKNKKFLNVQRQIRAKAKPWKTLNPMDMQHYL